MHIKFWLHSRMLSLKQQKKKSQSHQFDWNVTLPAVVNQDSLTNINVFDCKQPICTGVFIGDVSWASCQAAGLQ